MGSLRVFNTLSLELEVFEPLVLGRVLMYVCGVTVYDYCHAGHARVYVVFDMIRRVLEAKGYLVRYVQNFTDIDDKIIARAKESGMSWQALVEMYIRAYFEDMDALGVRRADQYPKATESMAEIQGLIRQLLERGVAYPCGGDICFSVDAFPEYGKLSGKVLADLIAGHRVEVNAQKRNPLDFVLWKAAKPGEPVWDSPWGKGRPGWHIECSAMAMAALGATLDIHGGGEDLVFPHHENEVAQSEACTHQPFAKYWIHNAFVNIRDEKMSKSLGNFVRIRDILAHTSGDAVRFYLLRTHYRTILQFSMEGLQESTRSYDRLCVTLDDPQFQGPVSAGNMERFDQFRARFWEAVDTDFNSAEAVGVLFDLNRWVHEVGEGASVLLELGSVLGLFQRKPKEDAPIPEAVQVLVREREMARAQKDWTRSDELRKQILGLGYQIMDTTGGSEIKSSDF